MIAVYPIISIILAGIAVFFIKRLFPAPRPLGILPDINVLGPYLQMYSFPSGHTASIFSLTSLVRKEYKNLTSIFFTTAVLVGLSRIYVGAHFPSDVIFGAGAGFLSGELLSMAFRQEKQSILEEKEK